MARTPELSKLTKAELTAMARRKKIPVQSGMLKDEMVKTIKKGLRKIEAQKKSKPATAKTRKRTTTAKRKSKTGARKKATAQRAKTSPKKAVRKKRPAKVKAKKTPAKTVARKPAPKPGETLPELPASYGDHRLVVMARDANWAYAYWELDPERVRDLTQSTGPSSTRWVLRVYSAALQPAEERGNYFDIVINVESKRFYLNLSRPGTRFIAAIGVVDASGIFRTAAESNPVIMPMDHPSETVAPQGNPAHPTAVFPVTLK